VVGEKSATSNIKTDFTPTSVDLQSDPITELGRRELMRMLEAEQGFAHRALPMGPGLMLWANGPLAPGADAYKKMIYEKGQAAAPGDRVMITSVVVKPDRIVLDINGGPYVKHRFLRHVSIMDSSMPVAGDPYEVATGSRVTLLFEGRVPTISGAEVKALLEPVIDFGVKSGDQAYAETLPEPIKEAVQSHDVLVGMTHRMVLAAMGAPDQKIREQESGDANGARYEEWIYGHVPQTVRFVRFVGDRVTLVEVAVLGKPMEIHDRDEMSGYSAPIPTREIAMGDTPADPDSGARQAPTLRKPGEPEVQGASNNKVQFPDDPKPAVAAGGGTASGSAGTPTAPSSTPQ
jgi:hypothetical protein